MQTIDDVPLILRREIEARMLAPFYDAFCQELGRERTEEIIRGVVARMAFEAGRTLAAEKPEDEDPFEFYLRVVVPRYSAGDSMGWERVEAAPGSLAMDAVRCEFAEMYRRCGLERLGELLSCERDPHLFRGLDERIELERSETLMRGCERCDFRLRRREE